MFVSCKWSRLKLVAKQKQTIGQEVQQWPGIVRLWTTGICNPEITGYGWNCSPGPYAHVKYIQRNELGILSSIIIRQQHSLSAHASIYLKPSWQNLLHLQKSHGNAFSHLPKNMNTGILLQLWDAVVHKMPLWQCAKKNKKAITKKVMLLLQLPIDNYQDLILTLTVIKIKKTHSVNALL